MRRLAVSLLGLLVLGMVGCEAPEPEVPKVRVMTDEDYHYLQAMRISDPESRRAKLILDNRDRDREMLKEARERKQKREEEKLKKMSPKERAEYERRREQFRHR